MIFPHRALWRCLAVTALSASLSSCILSSSPVDMSVDATLNRKRESVYWVSACHAWASTRAYQEVPGNPNGNSRYIELRPVPSLEHRRHGPR